MSALKRNQIPKNKEFITTFDQITPQWLEDVLRERGALQSGRVLRVTPEHTLDAPMSNVIGSISVEYESVTLGEPPPRIFFKNGRMYGEVSFQKSVARFLPQALLVPCYHAAYKNELGQSNLLFADLQPTHNFPSNDADLAEAEYLHLMSILATLHHALWEHPELTVGGEIGAREINLPVSKVLDAGRQNFPQFSATLGERLTSNLHRRYEKIFANLPHPLWQSRRNNLQNMTVVHGDVQMKNLALPRRAGHSVFLVDWSLWHVDFPTYDLAYLLALHTTKEKRDQLEMNCLKEYHNRLGVPTYSFEQLLEDYRQSIIFHTIWASFFQLFAPLESWLPLFENIMQAYDDWDCDTCQGFQR